MKIVMLDIDGVLNSGAFVKAQGWQTHHADYLCRRWEKMIDPVAVGRLNRLLEVTKAKIVVSSSWRVGLTQIELEQLFRNVGVKGEVYGYTPTRVENRKGRGDEIQAWLTMMQPEKFAFVILDDGDDMLHLKPYLVRTNPEVGLTEADVDLAIEMLGLFTV